MAYDINSTLERLEQNLKDLDSARKQVESSVNASNNLQKVVGDYVSSVKALCERLQSWEKELSDYDSSLSHNLQSTLTSIGSSCDTVIKSFNTKVEDSANEFKTKTENTITKFTTQNAALADKVKDLNAIGKEISTASEEIKTFKATLSQLSKQIKEAKDVEDAALKDIKNHVAGLQNALGKQVGEVKQHITDSNQDIKTSLVTQRENLGYAIDCSTKILKEELAKIDAHVYNNAKSLETFIKRADQAVIINRWLMIIGFTVFAVLHIFVR